MENEVSILQFKCQARKAMLKLTQSYLREIDLRIIDLESVLYTVAQALFRVRHLAHLISK